MQPKRSLKEILEEKKAKQLAIQEEQAYAAEIAEGNSSASQTPISQIAIEYVAPTKAEVSAAQQGLTSSSTETKPSKPSTPSTSAKPVTTKNSLLAMLQAKKAASQNVAAVPVEEIEENLKPFASQNEAEGQAPALGSQTVEASIEVIPYCTEGMLVSQAVASAVQKESSRSETFSLSISLNKEQLLAKELAFQGKSFCLIGAAGTGKTTAQREIAAALLAQNKLSTHTFRIQGTQDRVSAPSIAFVAYTRIASGNLRRAIHKDPALEEALTHNVTTIHNLLEYTPEYYYDYESNEEKFRFAPRRTGGNPLDITHLIIEESSMVGLDLWVELFDALRPDTQIIFIGDINQLPPVFGPSILNYALVQLPTVELTQVYRQAGDSSILLNAHKILAGKTDLVFDASTKIIRGGNVQFSQAKLAQSIGLMIPKWMDLGEYDPEQDIFLSPWNKQDLGTKNLNNIIAQHIGDRRKAIVYEIICGIAKIYLAVGDKVLYNKQVGYVKQIRRNLSYVGKAAKQESENLTRFGTYRGSFSGEAEDDPLFSLDYENISLEEILEQEQGEKKRQASHIVEIQMETDVVETLSAVGDFSDASFSLGYCLTVHKAQGCEWRKVYFILHKDHAISAYRELLYTATTRAREQLRYITKDAMLQKSIATQRIKGNTLAEKIEYFNSGLLNQEDVKCTK